jgi:hypothetical protein
MATLVNPETEAPLIAVERSIPRPRQIPAGVRKQCVTAIGLFLAIVLALTAVLPASLRYGYPVLAFAVAIFLFTRSRTFYIGFVFWLWFVSPFLRRVVDYRTGFVPTNPLLLASFLATAVSGYVLVTRMRLLGRPAALPFTCALAAIFFGTVVGLTRYPAMAVAQAVLNWIVPVLFAFFLYAERDSYGEYQVVIERSLLYGTLVVGAYGVYQFFFLPAWDKQWMIDLDARTFGVPEALQIRVFSTLNAPATCAAYMMAGLLMLFALKGRLRMIAAPVAFLSFILTSSRSSWIGILFGIGYLTMQLPNKARLRVVAGILACVIFLFIAAQLPVVDDMVSARMQSFTDPKKDVSYNERVGGHIIAFQKLLSEPMGEGMGSVDTDHATTGGDASIGPHDSTVLESLYALGFPGSILYLIGIIAGALRMLSRSNQRTREPFAISMRAIAVAFFIQALLNSIFVGVFGFMVWTAIGMALAAGEPLLLRSSSEPELGSGMPSKIRVA